LQNILAHVRRGRWAPPVSKAEVNEPAEEQNFREFATDWFDQIRRELRPSTAIAYRWHLIDHLLPFFQKPSPFGDNGRGGGPLSGAQGARE
jgi:hypothetical protein